MLVENLIGSSKAIFFDHDDTLVRTKEAKFAQHKHVAHTYYGKVLSNEELRQHWGKPLPQLVCLLYGTDNSNEALANHMSCSQSFPKEIFPETIPTLYQLQRLGKLTGIITATTYPSLIDDLSFFRIPQGIIGYLQTVEDTTFHKPDPRVFEPAIAWLKERHVQPHEVLYIGDGLHDMRAALGAGFKFVGVETGLVSASEFQKHGAVSLPSIGGLIRLK